MLDGVLELSLELLHAADALLSQLLVYVDLRLLFDVLGGMFVEVVFLTVAMPCCWGTEVAGFAFTPLRVPNIPERRATLLARMLLFRRFCCFPIKL